MNMSTSLSLVDTANLAQLVLAMLEEIKEVGYFARPQFDNLDLIKILRFYPDRSFKQLLNHASH